MPNFLQNYGWSKTNHGTRDCQGSLPQNLCYFNYLPAPEKNGKGLRQPVAYDLCV